MKLRHGWKETGACRRPLSWPGLTKKLRSRESRASRAGPLKDVTQFYATNDRSIFLIAQRYDETLTADFRLWIERGNSIRELAYWQQHSDCHSGARPIGREPGDRGRQGKRRPWIPGPLAVRAARNDGELFLRRRHAQDAAGGIVGQQVDVAVGALADVADAFAELVRMRSSLTTLSPSSVSRGDQPVVERAGTDFPSRPGTCRRCRRPCPTARSTGPVADRCSMPAFLSVPTPSWRRNVAAVGDHRPAVVAALRMMLISSPPRAPCSFSHNLPVARVEREAFRVALAVGPDFGRAPCVPTKGLSGGALPSRRDAHDLADGCRASAPVRRSK